MKRNKASQFRSDLFGGHETFDSGRNNIIGEDRICAFGEVLGGRGFHRIFFGLPAPVAVEKGFLLTERSYFETSDSPAALQNAIKSRELLEKSRRSITDHPVLDVYAGTGQVAWAFAEQGFKVVAFENHKKSHLFALNNLKISNVSEQVACRYGDGVLEMKKAYEVGRRYCVVYLDPPWNGEYEYTFSKPFRLDSTVPTVAELADSALKISDIAIFKFPQNVEIRALRSLARKLDVGLSMYYYMIRGFKRELCEVSAFMARGLSGWDCRTLSIPSGL